MLPERYIVPRRLNESTALQAAADLALVELNSDEEFVIDFSGTQHFEPFGMLYVGSAVRRLQHRATAARSKVTVVPAAQDDGGFAGHMGFWHSMGLSVGRLVNAPAGNESYLPITRIDIAELFQQAGGDPRASGLIESEASKLARILSKPYSESLLEALTYSLREVIRNVIEHAMSASVWIAGMTWPTRDYVQIAIVDEGRGIRSSLADNPEFRFATDAQALVESLKPGVTRNKGRIRSRAEIERWEDNRHLLPLSIFENAGYGLYMVSAFCREAGQFLIASGSSYQAFVASADLSGATLHKGTALRLVVEPTKVGPAFERLFETVEQSGGGARKPLLSASKLRRLGLDSLMGGGGDTE
jgi:hypothetical protein